jgi:hypothetical protein
MSERWKAVPGYEGWYEVSDRGRVRSMERVTCHGHTRKQRVLRPGYDRGGYLKIDLSRNNVQCTRLLHQMVLEAFVGPRPEYLQACHNNGVRDDNRLTNLRWGTVSDNAIDRNMHSRGTEREHASPRAILTAADVRFIRSCGLPAAEIRKRFPQVKEAALAHVRARRTWKHIE